MSEATSSAPAGSVFVDDFEQGEQFDILGVIRVKVLVPRSGRKGCKLAFTGPQIGYTPDQLKAMINAARVKTVHVPSAD